MGGLFISSCFSAVTDADFYRSSVSDGCACYAPISVPYYRQKSTRYKFRIRNRAKYIKTLFKIKKIYGSPIFYPSIFSTIANLNYFCHWFDDWKLFECCDLSLAYDDAKRMEKRMFRIFGTRTARR